MDDVKQRKIVIKREDRIKYILQGVCDFYNITQEELVSYTRTGKFNRKKIAIKLLYDVADITYKDIMKAFDRTSWVAVWQAYQNITEDLDESSYGNKELKKEYKELLSYLNL